MEIIVINKLFSHKNDYTPKPLGEDSIVIFTAISDLLSNFG